MGVRPGKAFAQASAWAFAFAFAFAFAGTSARAFAGTTLLWAFANTFMTLQIIELNLKNNINNNNVY